MLHIRPYAPADLASLVDLINEADDIDQTGFRTTPAEFSHSLGESEPTFVAEENDRLVGYIQLPMDQAPGARIYYGYGAVSPDRRRQGIGTALFRHALDHLRQVSQESTDRIRFQQFARLWIPGVEPLVQKLGFERGKNLLSLRRPNMDQLILPQLPPDYELRPVSPADAADCADVYNSGYTWRGEGAVRTAGEMAEEMTAPGFRPDLFPVAVNPDGRVIGYAYSVLSRTADGIISNGRLYTIAVSEPEQGKGIGRALLWACLHALKQAGAPQATLSVEADNPTPAMAMYRRAGFAEWRQSVMYFKVIR